MPEPDPIRPNDDKPLCRASKNAALFGMLLLLFLMAASLVRNNDPASAEITYTEFRAQLSAGNVHQVTVTDRDIEGELRAPVIKADQEITRFQLTPPGEMTD